MVQKLSHEQSLQPAAAPVAVHAAVYTPVQKPKSP